MATMNTAVADVRWFCNNEKCSRYKVEILDEAIDLDKNPGYNCEECDNKMNTASYVTASSVSD